jgi:hypothetical protein
MKAITIRVGPETHRLLERRAKAFHRSIAQQMLFDALQMMEMDAFANSTLRAPERKLSRTAPSASGSQRNSKRGGGDS